MAQKSTFYLENQNSETTFISSTLKVEEKKVVRILILLVKSGFLATFWNFDFFQTSVPKRNSQALRSRIVQRKLLLKFNF